MNIGVPTDKVECPLFRLEVFKIGQPAKVCAQMGWAEMGLEE